MSFNIRGDNLDLDSIDNSWYRSRFERTLAVVAKYHPDFVGLQEASTIQVSYFTKKSTPALPDYQHVGDTDRFGIPPTLVPRLQSRSPL